MADDIIKMSQRCIAQSGLVKRGRVLESALNDHAVAVTHARMARSAIDVEAFLATLDELLIQCESLRQLVAEIRAMLAGQEVAAGIKLLVVHLGVFQTGHRTAYGITRGPAIRIELTGAQGNKLGLVVHVLAAAGENRDGRQREKNDAELCRRLNTAPP
jgi:hypothetical protein